MYAAKAKRTAAFSRSVDPLFHNRDLQSFRTKLLSRNDLLSWHTFIENICFLATRVRAMPFTIRARGRSQSGNGVLKVPLCSRM